MEDIPSASTSVRASREEPATGAEHEKKLHSFEDLATLGRPIVLGGHQTNLCVVDPGWEKLQLELDGILRIFQREGSVVLLTGETGVGKEEIAQAFCRTINKTPVEVNCAAIPSGIAESELFGHQKGAFTGAIRDKKGLFEQADGGVLFLDEIGDLSPALQVALLRVLEEKKVRRVGGESTKPVNVRIICATNRDLKAAMRKGTFREDLWHRIKTMNITISPLRNRRSDIPMLVGVFALQAKETFQHKGMTVKTTGISPEALEILETYPWLGNVRELKHVMEVAIAMAQHHTIVKPEHLRLEPPCSSSPILNPPTSIEELTDVIESLVHAALEHIEYLPLRTLLALVRRTVTKAALKSAGGNKTNAAKILGVSRQTLHKEDKQTRSGGGLIQ